MDKASAGEFVRRHGLALMCVIAPLALSVIVQIAVAALVPNAKVNDVALSYTLRDGTRVTQTVRQDSSPEPAQPASKAAETGSEKDAKKVKPDPTMQLWASYLAGRYNIAVTIGIICLISIFVMMFCCVVIAQRAGPKFLTVALAASCAAAAVQAYAFVQLRYARVLLVDRILDAADKHDSLQRLATTWRTVDIVDVIIGLTNFIGYTGSFLIAATLYVLSVRASPSELKVETLRSRRDLIRITLLLASVLIAVGVISFKILLQWPLDLLVDAEKEALSVMVDAIVLRWGALGTIMLFAAFTPAIAAWSLDVHHFRSHVSGARKSAKISDKVGHDDGLDFAVMPVLGGLVAVLAPALASPFLDALKALLVVVK